MSQDVGDLGEELFQTLCRKRRSGLHAQRIERDRKGHDFAVEMAPPTDLRPDTWALPTDIVLRIQVKSTLSQSTRSVGVKLSNMLMMVRNVCPCFIVLLRIDDNDEIGGMSVVHFDAQMVRRTLDTSFGLDAMTKPHDVKVSVHFPVDSDLPRGREVEELRPRLLRDVGNTGDYAFKKTGWAGTLNSLTEWTVDALEHASPQRALAEWSVGLRETLHFRASTLEVSVPGGQNRRTLENVVDVSGTMQSPLLPSIEGYLVYRQSPTNAVRIPVCVYISTAVFPDLPEEHRIIRIVGTYVEVVMGGNTHQVRINVPEQDADLQAAARVYALNELFSKAGTGPSFELEIDRGLVVIDTHALDSAAPQLEDLRVAKRLHDILIALHMGTTRPVNLRRLQAFSGSVDALHEMLTKELPELRMSFTNDSPLPHGSRLGVPIAAYCPLDRDSWLICDFVLVGHVRPGVGSRWVIDPVSLTVMAHHELESTEMPRTTLDLQRDCANRLSGTLSDLEEAGAIDNHFIWE